VHVQRTSRALLVVMLLVGPAWAAPAAAETFTANWTFYTGGKVPAPSPFYDCDFMGSGGLICQWIWSQGLRLSDNPPNFPMYGDGAPYFDAYGFDLPLESEASGALLQIVPKCLGGICFGTFTPLSIVTEGRVDFYDYYSPDGVSEPGGVFFASSKGGLITTLDGLANFAGPEWTDITWMGIGLFWPDGCGDPYPTAEEWIDVADSMAATEVTLTYCASPGGAFLD